MLHTTIWRHSKKTSTWDTETSYTQGPTICSCCGTTSLTELGCKIVNASHLTSWSRWLQLLFRNVPNVNKGCLFLVRFFGFYIYDSWLYRLTPALSLFQHEKIYIYILLGKSLEVSYASHQDSHGILCLFPGAPWPPVAWSSQPLHSRRFARIPRHQSLRPVDDVGFPVHLQVFVASKSNCNGQFFVVDTPMDLRSLGHTVGEQRKWSPPSPLPFRWGRCWKTSSLLVCRESHRQTILVEHPILV